MTEGSWKHSWPIKEKLTLDKPEFILVPKGYTVEMAAQALILVRRMGLLKESTAGWLLIPAEAAHPFQGADEGEADASR